MSTAIKNVALFGAGGNLGPAILNALLAKSYAVTVFSRTTSSYAPPTGVKLVKTDLTVESLTKELKGQDAVVSVVASAALLSQKTIIDAAIAAGVSRFIPSEFGSDTQVPGILEHVPIFGHKLEVLAYLDEAVKKNPGFSYTAIANGGFFDWGLAVGFLGIDAKAKKATLYDEGNTLFGTTNLATVGVAVAAVLSKPKETENKYLYISDAIVSQKSLLEAFEKQTGSKFEVSYKSSAEVTKQGWEALNAGDFNAALGLIIGDLFGPGYANLKEEKLSDSLLGIELKTADVVVKEYLATL
jgi:uncharacterized protein YbjT (DUF2867 family)